jgi:stage 0 sporulation protein B (sporulation initiation phosphotransferase)
MLYCIKENVCGVCIMGKEQLSLSKALNFARHDFLNDLQIVLMYIDLGKVPEAKKAIQNATEGIRQLSILDRLGLPETEQWISTFGWMYSAFRTTLECEITPGIREADDLSVATYLSRIFSDIEGILDVTSEYDAHFVVKASASGWSIHIAVNGAMHGKPLIPETGEEFLVEEAVSDNEWTFTISGR